MISKCFLYLNLSLMIARGDKENNPSQMKKLLKESVICIPGIKSNDNINVPHMIPITDEPVSLLVKPFGGSMTANS